MKLLMRLETGAPAPPAPVLVGVVACGTPEAPRYRASIFSDAVSYLVELTGSSPEEAVGKAVLHARRYYPEARVDVVLDRDSEEAAGFLG